MQPPLADDDFAKELRGFGPIGIVAMLVILLVGNFPFAPTGAILVLLWVWRSHTPWREIGYVRPRSWIATVVIGILFGIAFKFVMKAIVMPLLSADPVNQAYHYLAGNRAALPGAIYALTIGAGFGEETVFRGYLFERFGKLIGRNAVSKAITVVVTALWFGIDHYSVQGLAGTEQAVVTGLVFGAIMAVTGQIFLLMFAHAAFDLTALWMIYFNLEPKIAHLVFK